MLRVLLLALSLTLPLAADAQTRVEPGALAPALAASAAGDTLILEPGRHAGPVILDRPVSLTGEPGAVIDAGGAGSVVTITAPDVTIRGLTITGSGNDGQAIDSGIRILKGADRALIEGNHLHGNLHGIDVHGGRDAMVRGNTIIGSSFHRVNDRGNGIYVWNSPGAVIEGNDIRQGRDGIFSNASKKNVFRNNIFRDLRFAVHFMYTNDSEVSGNVSIGNTLGYALMFSDRIMVRGNLSLGDRTHGLMLNYANNADVSGNLVRGGTHEKCTFIYNAHKNLIANNRFEGCEIGNCANKLRRAVRAATYAKALKSVRADTAFALQSPRPEVRLFCLAAIAVAQSRPLVKAALFSTGLDGYARVALLRAFEKEPRLLAAVDRIVLRNREKLRRAGV